LTVSFAIRPSDLAEAAAEPAPTLLERLVSGDVRAIASAADVTRAASPEAMRSAIGEIYRTHHAVVRAFANRFLGDAAAAEDLVHDVFVVLPSAIRRFRGDASLRSFLIAIAVKRGYKHVRSAGRRRAAMARLADQPTASPLAPDAVLAQHQLARALYTALDRLPRDQRTAFALCEIDGMTAAEAAAIVDAPEATVRTRVFHARKKLRASLAAWEVR
jgi:RNA polymerase sigma-70 factor (ECF subfamily)